MKADLLLVTKTWVLNSKTFRIQFILSSSNSASPSCIRKIGIPFLYQNRLLFAPANKQGENSVVDPLNQIFAWIFRQLASKSDLDPDQLGIFWHETHFFSPERVFPICDHIFHSASNLYFIQRKEDTVLLGLLE